MNDINGVYIASSVEAKNYPIYLTQYHPEVVLDVADDINANRHPINFRVAFSFASFFTEECSKSNHRFHDLSQLDEKLVKNGFKAKIEFIVDPVNSYAFTY